MHDIFAYSDPSSDEAILTEIYPWHADLTAASLSELCHIGHKQAKATMDTMTQGGMRSAIIPLSPRYRSYLQGWFVTGTLFANMKSLHGNICFQLYSYKAGFAACYPQINVNEDILHKSIDNFVHDFGASERLTFNRFTSQVGNNTIFYKNLRKYSINHHVSAPRRLNEKPAEDAIREIKRQFYQIMERKSVPKRI